jgi:hypothetical protein
MKAKVIIICLCLTSLLLLVVGCQSFFGKPVFAKRYVIMVPPTHVGSHYNTSVLRTLLEGHASSHMAIFPKGIKFLPKGDINHPSAGLVGVTAFLFPKQVLDIKHTFLLPGISSPNPVNVFIGPSLKYHPAASPERMTQGIRIASSGSAQWAANIVAPSVLTVTTPVNPKAALYVVDTGMLTHISTTAFHPQFPIGTGVNQPRILQGQDAPWVGTWPPTTANPTYWALPIYTGGLPTPLPLAAGGYLRSTIPTWALSPYKDSVGHGTKIASTAIGTILTTTPGSVGFMGRTTGAKYDVQSIRVYNSSNTYTQDAIDGIGLAVESHQSRGASAESVLLFASRTDAGFDPNLELALWWAWHEGIVVVVAGGNTPTAYATNPSTLYSPDSQWYTDTEGSLPEAQPTSPSRFDWVEANAHPDRWPAWEEPQADIPYPDHPYLIVVGGSNATSLNPTYDNWAAGSSRGPDIDIIAPFANVPVAKTSVSTLYTTNDCLANDSNCSGTSFSTGYVAGFALACLANTSGNPTPEQFRDWLFPANGPNVNAAPLSNAIANPTHYRSANYNNMVPKLKATTLFTYP